MTLHFTAEQMIYQLAPHIN